MDIQEILADLKYATDIFPHQALQEAVAKQKPITPFLLKIIENAKLLPAELYEENYMAHIYAMYLLGQFREKLSYPLIIDFFSISDEIFMDSTDDVVTEDLHRILASVAHGDASLTKALVENEKADEYVRSAALKTFLMQMVHGELTRDKVIAYYQSLFRGGLKRESSIVWDDLVCFSTDLYPEEVIEDIRQAYAEELIDDSWIGIEDVEKTLKRNKADVLKELYDDRRYRFVEDVTEGILFVGSVPHYRTESTDGTREIPTLERL